MKPRSLSVARLSLLLATAIAALLSSQSSQAADYYWDSNGTTAGLGNTGSLSWQSATTFNYVSLGAGSGRIPITGTLGLAAAATTTADTMSFGYAGLALGATASTVTVSGTQSIGQIIFGSSQSNAMTLSGGTLTFAAAGTITVNNTTDTISSVIGSAGATTSLTKAGGGTLVLSAAELYTGSTIITGGTLDLGGSTANGSLSSTVLTLGGGTLSYTRTGNTTQAFTTTNINAGASGATTVAGNTLTLGNIVRSAGGTVNFGNTGTIGTTLANNGSGILGGWAVFNGGANWAINNGSNVITGGATYFDTATNGTTGSGYTTAKNMDVSATTNMVGTINPNSIRFNAAAASVLTLDTGNNIINSGGILITPNVGNNLSTIAGGNLLGSSGGELIVNQFNTSNGLTISSNINDNTSATGLTKAGGGLLTISGTNGYTGTTRINAGTLAVSGGAAIADAGSVVLANAAGATLQLNSNETITSLTGGGLAGGTVNTQGNTLTLGGASTSMTFDGALSGTSGGAITKNGTGTLTLSRPNTFAGSINLSAGALTFTYGNDGSAAALAISSGGAINMAGGTTINFSPATNISAGVAGNQLITAPNNSWTIGNAINLAAGTATYNLKFQGNDNRWTFNGTVTGGTSGVQTLSISNTAADRHSITLAGAIANGVGGTVGLNIAMAPSTAANPYAVNLSGLNTFTGPIVVTTTGTAAANSYLTIGGVSGNTGSDTTRTSIVTGSGYLGGGNYTNTITLTQAGVVLDYASSANQTLGGAISGAGAILKEGAGTLTLSTANSYTGKTSINAGILSVSSLASAGSNSNIGAFATAGAGGISLGGGTLQYAGSTGVSVDRGFTLAAASTIDVNPNSTALTLGASSLGAFQLNVTGGTGSSLSLGALTLTGAATLNPTTANLTVASATSTNIGLTLSGSSTGNSVTGAIATGSGTITKSGSGTWTISGNMSSGAISNSQGDLYLSGTNSYSGSTSSPRNSNVRNVIFQGIQALSANTTISYVNAGGVGSSAIYKILDDGAGTISKAAGLLLDSSDTTSGMTLFVGNNGSANGGNGAGGTTGSMIALGNLNVTENGAAKTSQTLTITGANSYRLQINNVTTNLAAAQVGAYTAIFNPTTAPITIAGNVQQAAGSTGTTTLNLDGTALDNRVTGNILDSADGTPKVLSLTKSNTNDWALDGTGNTFTGAITFTPTTTSGGILSYASAAGTNAITFNTTTGFGSTLSYTGAAPLTMSGLISATAITSGGITIEANGATSADTINYSNGSSLSTTSASTSTRFITLGGSNTGDNTFAGAINNNTGAGGNTQVAKQGAGKWVLTGNGNYSGGLFINNGTISTNSIPNGGVNSPLGANTRINLGRDNTTGTLIYTGGGNSTDRDTRIGGPSAASGTGGGSILNDGSGALTFTAAAFNITQTGILFNRTLTLGGSSTGFVNEIQGTIVNNTASTGLVNLVKTGVSTWQLSGTSTYTGTTTIQAGSLVAGSNAPSSGNGAFGGSAGGPLVLGNAATLVGDAPSLLISGASTVGRDISVGSGATTSFNATIGGSNTSGTSTFSGSITLGAAAGYTATLQAATGGTVDFTTGTWTTNNKAVAIGSAGKTGTVKLSNAIATSGGISVNYGTLELNNAFTSGNMTVASGTTLSGSGSVSGTTGVTSATVNGSGLTLTGVTTFNSTGNVLSGTVTSTGGASLASGAGLALNGALTGALDIGNGTITGSGGSVSGAATLNGGTINLSSGSLGSLAVTGGNWNGAGSVTGAVTSSSGTFNISSGADLTAASGVTVTGGALVVNGTLTGTLIANSSTTVSGTGTVTGNAIIQGTHNPGNSPGIQTYGSNLTYSGGLSVVNWELADNTTTNAPNPVAIFDQIIVGGDLDFTDLTTINLAFNTSGGVLWGDTFWDSAQSWTLYDVAGTTTNVGNLSLTTINWFDSGSFDFNTSRPSGSFSLSQIGNDVVLNYTVVPEPNVAALLGCLGVISLLRRRRA